MEPVSLALGVIPVAQECFRLAFSIQRICRNLKGGYGIKKEELCTQIDGLVLKMNAIRDVVPVGTTLIEDTMKLRHKLGILQQDLEALISRSWFKRIFSYDEIGRGLDDALEMVNLCERSFQTSCACYLVKTGGVIQTVAKSVSATENNTGSIMVSLESIRQKFESLQSQAEPRMVIPVRYLRPGAGAVPYEVGSEDIVADIIMRMREDELDVTNIHFYSWSEQQHGCTDSRQTWRYRNAKTRLSTIKNECGKQDGQDTSWRLEYVRRPGTFTLFLVHRVKQETGLLIPHPVDAIQEQLQKELSIPNLKIVECRDLENGANFDWTDMQLLRQVRPYRCSLCVRLEEDAV